MAIETEIDIATAAIEKANEETSGASYSELLRNFAQAAIEAVDRYRDQRRRENCLHPNKRGSGTVSSDGSGFWDWYCPDCGISTNGKTPPRAEAVIPMPQNGGK